MRYMERPKIVDAVKWSGVNDQEVEAVASKCGGVRWIGDDDFAYVRCGESTFLLHVGEWLVCNGESLAALSDEEFLARYTWAEGL